MRKKTSLLTAASFLLLLLIILHTSIGSQFNLQIIKPVKASPATIIVPTNFTRIQDAINNASDRDIILVEAGTYPERVVVNKTVSLIGENPVTTIIDGNGTGTVVLVTSPNVSIINFTIRNGGGSLNDFGVWVLGVANTTIRNNIIRNNPNGGIMLYQSNNNIIIGNTLTNNWAGVILKKSNGSNVIRNTLANNTYGAYIEYSSSNTFYRNNFINNTERARVLGANKWDNGAEGNYWSDYTGKDLDGDGIGDEPYPEPIFPMDSYPLIEPWSLMRVFDVYQNGEHHYITIYCNSTVGHRKGDVSFLFSQPESQVRFNVTGPPDTFGFCNVTIPRTLLNATSGNWTVWFDDTNKTDEVDINQDATHTFFKFNYTHTTHRVRIIGTEAIPNEPPTANFTYLPQYPTVLDFINFTDASTDPDGTIIGWYWDFGDGSNSTEQNPTHKYANRTSYNVTLTVTDSVQASNSTTKTITLVNAPPTANFTYSPTPKVDQYIQFTDTSTDPEESIVARLWKFGDDTNSTEPNPTHKYSEEGTYNVTLTIKDDENATDTTFRIIVVTKVGTKLTLNVPSTATARKTIVVTAVLKDESDNPVSDETIEFYFYENAEWKKFDSASTNATGSASVPYTPAIAGEYQIMAIYNGSSKYAENSSTVMLTVNLIVTTLTVDAPSTATSGRSVTITANLEDENGAPVQNATIEFYLFENGTWKTIGSSLTDSNGVAVLEYTPHEAGELYIKVEFPGTQIYDKNSYEIKLNVTQARFDYTSYILVGVAVIAAIALIAFAIWRKRKKPSKI